MSVLAAIVVASVLGGLLSVGCAAAAAAATRAQWVPVLISFAIGALLGAVFLEILPHALESTASAHQLGATLLVGVLLFFVLEKMVLWRHSHGTEYHGHARHSQEHASATLIMVGDTVHNFVDGIIIATAFLTDMRLGVSTALAVIAHEIPQEVGDFLVLLQAGYSKRRALLLNIVSSIATLVGALLAYFALQSVREWIPLLLGVAAASLLYVAVADLIPGLHRRAGARATLQQVALIALGVGTIWGVHLLGAE